MHSPFALLVDPTQALAAHARQPEGLKFLGFLGGSAAEEPEEKDEGFELLVGSRFWAMLGDTPAERAMG